jgi:hypothetical protein
MSNGAHTGFSLGESLESSVQTSSGSFTPVTQPTKVRKMAVEVEARAPKVPMFHQVAMAAKSRVGDDVVSIASSRAAISVASSRTKALMLSKVVAQAERELAQKKVNEARIDQELNEAIKSSQHSAGIRSEVQSVQDPNEDQPNLFAGVFSGAMSESNLVEFNVKRLQQSCMLVQPESFDPVVDQVFEEYFAQGNLEPSSPDPAISEQGNLASEPRTSPPTINEDIFHMFSESYAELPEVSCLPEFEQAVVHSNLPRISEDQVMQECDELQGNLEPEVIHQTTNYQTVYIQQHEQQVAAAHVVATVEQLLSAQSVNNSLQAQLQLMSNTVASLNEAREKDRSEAREDRASAYQQGVAYNQNSASVATVSLPEPVSEVASTNPGVPHFNISTDNHSDFSSAKSDSQIAADSTWTVPESAPEPQNQGNLTYAAAHSWSWPSWTATPPIYVAPPAVHGVAKTVTAVTKPTEVASSSDKPKGTKAKKSKKELDGDDDDDDKKGKMTKRRRRIKRITTRRRNSRRHRLRTMTTTTSLTTQVGFLILLNLLTTSSKREPESRSISLTIRSSSMPCPQLQPR